MPRLATTIALALLCASVAGPAWAGPGGPCESALEGAAGKFLDCRLKAEAKHSRYPDDGKRTAAFAKCTASFLSTAETARLRNGPAACSPLASTDLQAYLADCADSFESAAGAGGTLPSCEADLLACSADLSACDASLASAVDGAGRCSTDLAACAAERSTCNGSLASTQASLATCNGSLASTQASLATCGGQLSACDASRTTCTGSLAACSADLGACGATSEARRVDLEACASTLAAARGGTATPADVRTGRTFTGAAGDLLAGTMPDRGAVSIVPGTSPQPIPAGLHDGSGTVAGDPGLVASNIRSGASIFGVEGSAPSEASNLLLQSGETVSHGPGTDGATRAGTPVSFTDNGDGTVTDTRTGLTWEKKSRDGSIHDADATFVWGQAVAPHAMNGTVATAFLAALNTTPCFAGHCDWRLPNLRELQSIADYGRSAPAVFEPFHLACAPGCTILACSCTPPVAPGDRSWTATTAAAAPATAWAVGFETGAPTLVAKDTALRARAVRGGSIPTDVCAEAGREPSNGIAAAACRAVRAFARNDFTETRDYLVADVVARRFGETALAGMWPMFAARLPTSGPDIRIYARIGDAAVTTTSAEIEALEGVDLATGPALHCRSIPYPAEYAARLEADLALGGYETSHVLLALMWIRDQGCADPTPAGFYARALDATAALIDADHAVVTDLEIECATLLAYLGESSRIPTGFVEGVLAAQLPSGGWRAGPGEPALGHTSALALWLLEEVLHPGSGVTNVTPFPRS